jgi:hypothetical protein
MNDLVGKLTPEKALRIVKRLTRKEGEIRDAVVKEAMNILTEVDVAGTAEDVFDALNLIDVQDCWDRSGSSRDGYTSPDEAAAQLVDEELQPFLDQIERYHELGMFEQETTYCRGVILGLYRYERESTSEFRTWAEDVASECAGFLLDNWRDRNREPARLEAMHEFIRDRCPDWAKWLKDTEV